MNKYRRPWIALAVRTDPRFDAPGAVPFYIVDGIVQTVSLAAMILGFAYYEPRPDAAARSALDRELYRAAAAVKTWPEENLYPRLRLP